MNIGFRRRLMTVLASASLMLCGCDKAETVEHNIAKDADYFNVYRKMTFVNLYSDKILYYALGRFSVRTSYANTYQGQQEIALVFKISNDGYKMDYFSIANNVTYVIEQVENTTTDPYHWEIHWYLPYAA